MSSIHIASSSRSKPAPVGRVLGWIVLGSVVSVLVFSKAMSSPLDHDEHQFVAGGALLARDGLLPYRDYPFFHTPYLEFLYAVLFRCSSHLLLTARITSCVFGVATAGLLAAANFRVARDATVTMKWTLAIVTVLLLLCNPLFTATNGLAWNHDASEFFLLAAALLVLRQMERPMPIGANLAAGLLLGLGVGVRLTVAPLVLPFLIFVYREGARQKRRPVLQSAAFLGGVFIALAPLIPLAAAAPEAMRFGNLEYPALSNAYWACDAHCRNLTPLAKLNYLFGRILGVPEDLILIVAIGLVVLMVRSLPLARVEVDRYRSQVCFLGILLLYLLAAGMAPTPPFPVYFYALIPPLLLLLGYLIAPLFSAGVTLPKPCGVALALLLAISISHGAMPYQSVATLGTPAVWTPQKLHRLGGELRVAAKGGGPVLTLAPIIPLEGGMDIYPAYETGPFAARIEQMVANDRRDRLHLLDEGRLRALLLKKPPSAVLIGIECNVEETLQHAARNCDAPSLTLSHTTPQCESHVVPLDPGFVATGLINTADSRNVR